MIAFLKQIKDEKSPPDVVHVGGKPQKERDKMIRGQLGYHEPHFVLRDEGPGTLRVLDDKHKSPSITLQSVVYSYHHHSCPDLQIYPSQ